MAINQVSQKQENTVLDVQNVTKIFHSRGRTTVALQGVSFSVGTGKIVALVGESGSGKTTIARIITGIEKPSEGDVTLGSWRVSSLRAKQLREYRRSVQMVFQDPFSSLNPHHSVMNTIVRPLMNHLHLSKSEAMKRAMEIMSTVRLAPIEQFANKKPHELSGGQRQRLVIARAIAPEPAVIVADEPVSMLDVSIRADILYLIDELRKRTDMSVLYITHDLYSARATADEVVVLYKGHVVEQGDIKQVVREPQHPYTQLLLEAIPNPRTKADSHSLREPVKKLAPSILQINEGAARNRKDMPVQGQMGGCPFAPRCSIRIQHCLEENPALLGKTNHRVACWQRSVD